MNVDTWKPGAKFGAVAVGYFLAGVLASIAMAIRMAMTSGPASIASSGMYAFGDSVVWVGVFGFASLVPTALALHLLRRSRGFWLGYAAFGLVLALTGTAAVVLYAVGRTADPHTTFGMLAIASPLRILLALPVTLSLAVSATFAPFPTAKKTLLIALLAEVLTGLYSVIVWFGPIFFWHP